MHILPDNFQNPSNYRAEETRQEDDFGKMNRDFFELCLNIHKTFTSESGAKVLEWLKQNTLESTTWNTGMSLFEAIPYGMAREGQNALIRDIQRKMKIAVECKSPEDLANKVRGI